MKPDEADAIIEALRRIADRLELSGSDSIGDACERIADNTGTSLREERWHKTRDAVLTGMIARIPCAEICKATDSDCISGDMPLDRDMLLSEAGEFANDAHGALDSEEVGGKADLEQLVREYIKLTPLSEVRGSGWGGWLIGKCPFHPGEELSLMMQRDHFRCERCTASGGAIEFVMLSQFLGYQDAVDVLRKRNLKQLARAVRLTPLAKEE